MDKEKIKNQILKNVNVLKSNIFLAKNYIMINIKDLIGKNSLGYSVDIFPLLRDFNNDNIIFQNRNTVDFTAELYDSESDDRILEISKSLSSKLSFYESFWGLIHSNVLLIDSTEYINPNFSCLINVEQGQSLKPVSLIRFNLPRFIKLAPSLVNQNKQILIDSDLYLSKIDIPKMHPEVKKSLEEAINCFRFDLYTPCLVMLLSAADEAWTEMGKALAKTLNDEQKISTKIRKILNSDISIKIKIICDLYTTQFDYLENKDGIKGNTLNQQSVWIHSVRESRNVIHPGHNPSLENTYEKTSNLLISAVEHFRYIYRIFSAASYSARSR